MHISFGKSQTLTLDIRIRQLSLNEIIEGLKKEVMKLSILEDFHDCKKLFFSTFLTRVSNGLYGTANILSFPSPTIP